MGSISTRSYSVTDYCLYCETFVALERESYLANTSVTPYLSGEMDPAQNEPDCYLSMQ